MSSHLWPKIEISKVNPSWFRPLQPGKFNVPIQISLSTSSFHIHVVIYLAREDLSLTKFEELLEQERRRYIDKGKKQFLDSSRQASLCSCLTSGGNLPFHGKTEMDNADVRKAVSGASS